MKQYKELYIKICVEFCRLLIGSVFVFSGTVKAIDPVGGAIKINDYLIAFGLDVFKRKDVCIFVFIYLGIWRIQRNNLKK